MSKVSSTISLTLVLMAVMFSTSPASAQTYTNNELVASAPIAWQVQHDLAFRLTIGNDDGNVIAAPSTFAWAAATKFGTAQGLPGLLYDFTISTEGPPIAFGLARRGCVAVNEATLNSCVRVRWERRIFLDGLGLVPTITDSSGTVFSLAPQTNVQPGQSFSIERVGNSVVNFYRSTGIAGERVRVATMDFPFTGDGSSAPIEAQAVFSPDSETRRVTSAQEIYYCCL